MSETPAPKYPQRLSFNETQAQAVLQAAKVQELTQKHIDILSDKIIELSLKEKTLKSELKAITAEIQSLQKETLKLSQDASKTYEETLNIVLKEFETPQPPWTANIVLDKGHPIGVDLIKNETVNS